MTDDELIRDHPYTGVDSLCRYTYSSDNYEVDGVVCGLSPDRHANPGSGQMNFILTNPHAYVKPEGLGDHCAFAVKEERPGYRQSGTRVCGYPEAQHSGVKRRLPVRVADVQQYARLPMPDEARGAIAVTLVDAPVDPLGTLAVICGIYKGEVWRSKEEVSDDQRRAVWADMQKTVLSGPLEAMQFTFLIEGVDRATTHQIVRSRFSFFAQESLRFAVAEDWAAEVALPPALLGRREDDPMVTLWRKGLNAAEDSYAALVAAGMPAEEARGLLPHAIPTRLFWTMSMRTLLMEAGKRTCTQAQFPWRVLMAGVAKALRSRAVNEPCYYRKASTVGPDNVHGWDEWQYKLFADAIQPVCYQTGRCGFKAEFDRACSIRARVDANEKIGRPSIKWDTEHDEIGPTEIVVGVGPKSVVVDANERPVFIGAIHTEEWLADPSAARVRDA